MKKSVFNKCVSVCRLLGNAINGSFDFCSDIDEDSLLIFSEHQKLTSMVCGVLEKSKSKTDYKNLFERSGAALYRQLKNDMLEEEIDETFDKNGISHIILKGSSYRRFYPSFLVRTSNDIDILVSKDDFSKALELLKTMEFNISSQNEDEIGLEKTPAYYIELHHSMGGLTKPQRSILAEIAEKAILNGSLCDSDFYIYTVYHLYKHFVFAGAGVRMLFDVYNVGRCENLDRVYIDQVLEKMDLIRFEKNVVALNEALFEGKTMTDEQREIARFVFESGAYGTKENANALKYVSNEISGKSCASAVISNYRLDMVSMKKRYSILEKTALLFPFCCVHRFFKGFLFKRRVLKQNIKTDVKVFKDERLRFSHILEISGII